MIFRGLITAEGVLTWSEIPKKLVLISTNLWRQREQEAASPGEKLPYFKPITLQSPDWQQSQREHLSVPEINLLQKNVQLLKALSSPDSKTSDWTTDNEKKFQSTSWAGVTSPAALPENDPELSAPHDHVSCNSSSRNESVSQIHQQFPHQGTV